VRWSYFGHARDNAPRNKHLPWSALASDLERQHESTDGSKRGMPAFSGASFRENAARGKEFVESIQVLCFDFDNSIEEPIPGEFWDEGKTRPKLRKVPCANPAHPEEVCRILKEMDLTFRAYTTWSCTPGWPKFRVVLPLYVALTPDLWESGTEWVLDELNLRQWSEAIDIPVLRDTARINFLPGSPEGVRTQFWGHDGSFLEIDIMELDRVEVQPIAKTNWAKPKSLNPADADWEGFGIDLRTLDLVGLMKEMGTRFGKPRKTEDGLKLRCTCPWGSEHSGGPDGDDAVVFSNTGMRWPSFNCSHSRHAHMNLLDVLEAGRAAGVDLSRFAESIKKDFTHLTRDSSATEIQEALKVASLSPRLRREQLLDEIKKRTGLRASVLRDEIANIIANESGNDSAEDLGQNIANKMLDKYFAGGAHLIQASDRNFWAYTGTHWRRVLNDNNIRRHLLSITEEVDVGKTPKSYAIDSAWKILCARQAREGDVLRLTSVQPRVVNCLNGELWLAEDGTATLRPHAAESYLTYVLDVDYNPDATCPRFDKALDETFGDEEVVRHVHELFGYTIQPHREYKTWWLFQGAGDNGKTKVVQTLQRLLNPSTIYPIRIADANKNEHSRAALVGKLLLLDDDVDTGTVLPDGFLKQVSEDKLLSGRNLYASSFEFVCTVVPLLLCNNWPYSHDLSQATQKRAMIVPFPKVFVPNRDTDPYPYIWDNEMSGVLNRALAGYRRLQLRGRFEEPPACLKAKRKFLAAANPLVEFTDSGCALEPGFEIKTAEFYKAFKMWCDLEGHRWIPRKGEMERDLVSLGFKIGMSAHLKQNMITGIRPMNIATETAY
jgi:putative DNA primase/helicase